MYESLVLSAGGTYGVAYVGAYKALEARFLTSSIKRFHCTSAGSIVATIAACGLTSAEMLRAMEPMCVRPRPQLKMADFSRLARDFGAMDMREYRKPVLDSFLPPAATFVTLAKSRGVNLSVHAYDVCDRKLVDFGLDATPNADMRECMEASCCVPFLFKPGLINDHRHVDGAVAQRTPLHMVVDPSRTLVLDVRDVSSGDPEDILRRDVQGSLDGRQVAGQDQAGGDSGIHLTAGRVAVGVCHGDDGEPECHGGANGVNGWTGVHELGESDGGAGGDRDDDRGADELGSDGLQADCGVLDLCEDSC